MKILYQIPQYLLASFAIIAVFLLSGCGSSASLGKLSTPSGRPEVLIPNSSVQSTMDGVAAWLASQGKPIDATGVYTITTSFTKERKLLGIPYDLGFTSVFTIVPNGPNTSVYGATYDHRNNDELNDQSNYEELQKQLVEIRDFIRSRAIE